MPALVDQAVDLERADVLLLESSGGAPLAFEERRHDVFTDDLESRPIPFTNEMQDVGKLSSRIKDHFLRLDEAPVAAIFRDMPMDEGVLVLTSLRLQSLQFLLHAALVLEAIVRILVGAALFLLLELHQGVKRIAEARSLLEQFETLRHVQQALHAIVVGRVVEIEIPKHGGNGQTFVRLAHALHEIDVHERVR